MSNFLSAIVVFVSALVTASATLAQDSVWVTFFGAGMKAYEQGAYSDAERSFRAAIEEAAKVAKLDTKKGPLMMAESLGGLGMALRSQRKFLDAERVLRKQVALNEMVHGKDHLDVSIALNNLGLVLAEQGKFGEAEKIQRRALSIREKQDKPPSRNVAASMTNLGMIYYESGRYVEAEALFNQALQTLFRIPSEDMIPEDMDLLRALIQNAGLINVKRGKYNEAEGAYKAAIVMTEKTKGLTHPDLLLPLKNYEELLRLTDREDEAAEIAERRRKIAEHGR